MVEASSRTVRGRVFDALLDATGRIRSRHVWHAVHRLIAREATVRVLGTLLRAASRGDEARRLAILVRLRRLCVRSGWPGHPATWLHLDVARLEWRLRRGRPTGPRPRRDPRAADGGRARAGIVGQLAKLTACGSPAFVAAAAQRFDVTVIDIEHGEGRFAGYVAAQADAYHRVPHAGWLETTARTIEEAELDLVLLCEFQSVTGGDLIDRIDTPCIGHHCTGSELLWDPRVDFQLQDQPMPDYFVRDERLYCTACRAPVTDHVVCDAATLFDVPDKPVRVAPWAEREPLVVFHGSLFKVAGPEYLDVVLGLLRDDADLRFVLFGKDESFGRTEGSWLGDVLAAARVAGVADRVEYRGEFSVYRGGDGATRTDAAWHDLVRHLARARLAPDPWPLGSGSARAESYAYGVPGAHMGVRLDPSAWGRPQLSSAEITGLLVPEATAFSVSGYAEICRRCLYDAEFADRVQQSQLEVVEATLDPGRYWDLVRTYYERWLAAAGR